MLHADGRRDTSIAKIPLHFAASDNTPTYAFQPDGKVLTAGSINGDFVVSRYHPDGALDESFGTAGRVTADFGHDDRPAGVGVQPDGTIIVGGISRDDESVDLQGDNGYGSFALAAYDPDGSVADFGENSRLAYKFYAPHSNVTDFIIDSQGNIAMAGWGGYGFGGGIIHINADGTVRRNALWETTRMWDLAFAGDNRLVAFSTDEGELKRFHLNSGSEIKLKLHTQIEFHIGKMAVAPDGDVIIATYDGRQLYVKRMQG